VNKILMGIVLDQLAFLNLSSDEAINPDIAARQMEIITSMLRKLPEDEQREVIAYAAGLAAKQRQPDRAQFFRSFADDESGLI
jgi:hypothetical protein